VKYGYSYVNENKGLENKGLLDFVLGRIKKTETEFEDVVDVIFDYIYIGYTNINGENENIINYKPTTEYDGLWAIKIDDIVDSYEAARLGFFNAIFK